ncbi:MAG: hypothetical protein AAF939_17170, partial [Planctomycetota bacterium]
MSVQTLNPAKIVETIKRLHARIGERFPNSGLCKVCFQLATIAENMEVKADWIGRPVRWLRNLTLGLCGLIVGISLIPLIILAFSNEGLGLSPDNWFVELVQITEAGINDVVLIGAAVFFL